MWAAFFGRLVNWWKLLLGALAVMIPVLAYVFGRKDGKLAFEKEAMQDAVRTEKSRADFYKDMGEASYEAQSNRPSSSDDLVDRVRKHGL